MTELEAVMAEVHALREIRANLEKELSLLTVRHKYHVQRADTAMAEVDRLRGELANALRGLDGDAATLVEKLNTAESELRRERARFKILAQHMPTFLTDFIATYSPFAPGALSQEYHDHLTTARDFLKILEPFGE